MRSLIKDDDMYYIILDEIQRVKDFELVLNGFLYEKNLDVYVTGSNSKFLSSDIITEFRGRGDQVKVNPLSFSEFVSAFDGDKYEAWNEYVTYGGMPLSALNIDSDEKTKQELRTLNNIEDSFKKIIVVKDNIKLWRTEEGKGIVVMGILEFLLNKDSLDL